MSHNYIWQCELKLKRKNPRVSSRHPFLFDKCTSLVILNESKEPVWNKTNVSVVNRTIGSKVDSKYNHLHIDEVIPIKNLGKSLAKD